MQNTTSLIINFDDFNGPNPYRFLSNFYVGRPISVFGTEWMTGEHAYQGMKVHPFERQAIKEAVSPGEAKMRGRTYNMRGNWEAVKYDVMMAVIRAKFRTDREEGELLVQTQSALLVEGTEWGDDVWGVRGRKVTEYLDAPSEVSSPGRNWLGTMLMARRAELVAEWRHGVIHNTGTYNAAFGK